MEQSMLRTSLKLQVQNGLDFRKRQLRQFQLMPHLAYSHMQVGYIHSTIRRSVVIKGKHFVYPVEDHPNWKDFYTDDEEEIPNGLPR
jgi:hypothetical protein